MKNKIQTIWKQKTSNFEMSIYKTTIVDNNNNNPLFVIIFTSVYFCFIWEFSSFSKQNISLFNMVIHIGLCVCAFGKSLNSADQRWRKWCKQTKASKRTRRKINWPRIIQMETKKKLFQMKMIIWWIEFCKEYQELFCYVFQK